MRLRWVKRKIHSHAKDSCENLYPCVKTIYVLQVEVPVQLCASGGTFAWRDIPVHDLEGTLIEDSFIAFDKNCQRDVKQVCVENT